MGVKITAWSGLYLVEEHEVHPLCAEGHIRSYTYAAFKRSAEGLADADVETDLGGDTVVSNRCYGLTDRSNRSVIMDVPYLEYGRWRSELALAATGKPIEEIWADPNPDLPFIDLLNFADNDGCIGPAAARRLLADFTDPKYGKHSDDWRAWIAGCRLAADDGLIRFS
jgi:hypothetical protein